MAEFQLVFGVVVMFLLRIGIPVLLLIILGSIIDRWQTARENDIRERYGSDDRKF